MIACVREPMCVYVRAFPHPWMASSAWSAWSAYPPQPPSSQSSWWRHVCALKSVSVWHVFLRLGGTHTVSRLLPLLILHHPLSAEPLFLSSALSCFFTPPHAALPPLSPSSAPFSLPLCLPPSFSLPLSLILSRRCSLPPTFILKTRAWVRKDVIQLENVDLVNYELICTCSLICG